MGRNHYLMRRFQQVVSLMNHTTPSTVDYIIRMARGHPKSMTRCNIFRWTLSIRRHYLVWWWRVVRCSRSMWRCTRWVWFHFILIHFEGILRCVVQCSASSYQQLSSALLSREHMFNYFKSLLTVWLIFGTSGAWLLIHHHWNHHQIFHFYAWTLNNPA